MDQRAARLDQRRADIEQPRLCLDQPGDPRRGEPPARLGVAAPGAGTRAGCVDQHDIGGTRPVGERFRLAAGVEQPRLDDRDAGPFRARHQARQARSIGIGGEQRPAILHRHRQSQRLAPAARAQIDHAHPRLHARGERDDLAAGVLNFDPAVDIGLSLLDRRIRRKAEPGIDTVDRNSLGHGRAELRHAGLERVDAQVERGAIQQRRGLIRIDARGGERFHQPCRRHIGRCRNLIRTDRRRPVRGAVERGREFGVTRRQRQQRRTAAVRPLAAQADRVVDQPADRAAVLRPGIAARGEPALDQHVRRSAAVPRRGDDLVEQLDRRLGARGRRHAAPPEPS